MDVEIDEGERQMLILAMATLAVERPGWDYALNRLALKMDNAENDRAVMFDQFKALQLGS
jgi:hypothetical protein